MGEPDPAIDFKSGGSATRIGEEQSAQACERCAAEKILAAAAPVTDDMSRSSR